MLNTPAVGFGAIYKLVVMFAFTGSSLTSACALFHVSVLAISHVQLQDVDDVEDGIEVTVNKSTW